MNDVGVYGMAVMGRNLAFNFASNGFNVAIGNRTASKIDEILENAKNEKIKVDGHKDLKTFVASLKAPKRIIVMVKAGKPVDEIVNVLIPMLNKGDIIIDAGNEWYKETERRMDECAKHEILYLGMGVSGGESGARYGPSMMPGGDKKAYEALQPLLKKIAAQTNDGACVTYIGPRGAGNFVKMVHNGIEYGDMQVIAEAYDLMRKMLKLSNQKIAEVFKKWNDGILQSFLIEITAHILTVMDKKKSGSLVDAISDVAASKGTGKWTVQEAAERGVPCPSIQAALDMRYLSAAGNLRTSAQETFKRDTQNVNLDTAEFIDKICEAVYCSKICCYTQGFLLLQEASTQEKWDLNMAEIGRIWKGGCIIRAQLLDDIMKAYKDNPKLVALILSPEFSKRIKDREQAWRHVVTVAQSNGISVPAMSISLAYFDGCKESMLPTNLVQAQRDFFGRHTFKRVDMEGDFSDDWE